MDNSLIKTGEPKILFEDENIVALNKPAGLIVHPDGKNDEPAVIDFLINKFPKIIGVGEPMVLSSGDEIQRPGIVHRIDRDTSGVLLVAKTTEGYFHLKEQFLERKIRKTYHTFVYGSLKAERGIISKPIGRSSGGVRRWAVSGIRGEVREAITKYKVIKETPEASFLEVWPLTGRTHQIRVHLKSIHHAIVCDGLYAPQGKPMLGFDRLALHASRIVFKDLKGKEVEVVATFPEDFVRAIDIFGIDPKNLRN